MIFGIRFAEIEEPLFWEDLFDDIKKEV